MTQPITDHAAFLGQARQSVEDLNQLKRDYSQMELEAKQSRRQLEAEKKAVEDLISITVKKRRDEINVSYDKQITKGQDQLKKARGKREKAKNQGIRDRIAEETAGFREENCQLKVKIRSLFQKERIPAFCSRGWYYSLYMPRTFKEIGTLLLMVLFFFAALPWGIYLLIPALQRRSWMLVVIYLADIFLVGGLYLMVGNRTKLGHLETIRQGRQIRDTIHSNQKKIRMITNSIRRDRNEAIYNLEKYDDEISRIVQQLAELTGKKQEALNTFNTVTQTIICDEITSNSKKKIDALNEQYEAAEGKRSHLEHQIRQQSLEITDKYEIYVGKEFMQPDKLTELARLIRSKQAANISEAISVYKAGKQQNIR